MDETDVEEILYIINRVTGGNQIAMARILGVSPSNLRAWINQSGKQIKPSRIGVVALRSCLWAARNLEPAAKESFFTALQKRVIGNE